MNQIITEHPFKDGVRHILADHLGQSIADRFDLTFEKDLFSKESIHIWRQKRDNMLILEVRYVLPSGLSEYICDVKSWWDKNQTTYHLLRMITDKVKAGKIGADWQATPKGIEEGSYATTDESTPGY